MAGKVTDSGGDLDENSEINVTPFIDVMLVLLIIFMVAAPLATVDMKVDLPQSASSRRRATISRSSSRSTPTSVWRLATKKQPVRNLRWSFSA